MTLIELLKITNNSVYVNVKTRVYGLTACFDGYPLDMIGSGQKDLLLRELDQQYTTGRGRLVILLKE